MWDSDLLFEGHKVVPYCVRCGTALSLARGRAGLRGRRGPVDLRRRSRSPSPPARCAPATGCWRGRRRRGRCSPTPRSPSRPTSPTCAPRTATCSPRRAWQAVLGEDARVAERFHGRDILGTRYEPPFDFIKTEEFGPKGHTVLPGDFVSADDGTGLVHTSISFGEDDYRLGQEQGIAVINPVRLDGTYDDRMGPYAGRWVKEADADIVEDLRDARAAAARGDLPARLPALLALRHAAALLRQAVLVHRHLEAARPPAGRQRDRRLAPGAHQARALRALAGEQRRLGDLARALLGHAAAGVALRERPRGVHGLARRAGRAVGRGARGPAPPLRRRADLAVRGLRRADAARARGDRRLVRLGLHAVRPAPRAVRERGAVRAALPRRTTSARRSTRRAAGSTR